MREALSHSLRWQVAAFSAGAAAIHFAEISPHIEEYWPFGVFFFVVAWFQAAASVGVVAFPHRGLLIATFVVNLAVVGLWVWSRTIGLPIGPELGEPESVGAADVVATVLEALLVGWAVALLLPRIASREASRGVGILTTVIVWAWVVGATAIVFFTETGEATHH